MKNLLLILCFTVTLAFTPASTVYICVSSTSVAYHADRNCRGLSACTHPIKAVTEDYAKDLGKRPCKICY